METPLSIRNANAEGQRKYVAGLDVLGLKKTTIVMPKEFKRRIDVYAASKGLSKREIWIDVIREGMKILNIS